VSSAGHLSPARLRLRLPRGTVRLRLTLLYSLLFLAAGAALLAVTDVLVHSATGSVDNSLVPSKALPAPVGSKSLAGPATAGESALTRELRAQARATHAIDMHQLVIWSGVGLAIMGVLAVALGWVVAGRMLRPLRAMARTTQRITEHKLHERLALPGPSDEIKDLADTIDGLLHRLETAFDSQRQFVANASHELRTPLALNRALLEFTLKDPDATVDDLRAMGHELLASGEQQEHLIDALLTLATSARGLERHDTFDLSDITLAVLAGPHPETSELGLDVQTAITPALAAGDARLAERLVANLIHNAVRHNVPGGYVSISTRTESGYAVLVIANSGPVILRDDIDRLFQPFQQLDRNRAHHPDGHGLGLSIVQSIAAAHGAPLSVRPRPGGGLDVEIRFPQPTPLNAQVTYR
jgi:signal transduction histidine kinase